MNKDIYSGRVEVPKPKDDDILGEFTDFSSITDKNPSILVEYRISNPLINSNDIKFSEIKKLEIDIFKHTKFWGELFGLIENKVKEIVKIPNNVLFNIDGIDINKAIKENKEIRKKDKID